MMRLIMGLLAGVAMTAGWVDAARTQEPAPAAAAARDAAARFGAQGLVEHISLSPNGRRIATVTPTSGEGTLLAVQDLVDGEPGDTRVALRSPDAKSRIAACDWISDDRLFCMLTTRLNDRAGGWSTATTVLAVDHDGANQKVITRRSRDAHWVDFDGGQVIDWLPEEDGALLLTRNLVPTDQRNIRGLTVHRIDTRTLESRAVEPVRGGAESYITDGHGEIRVMLRLPDSDGRGYWSDNWTYHYRRRGERDWRPLSVSMSGADDGFSPVAVDRDQDVAYGFKRHQGRVALYRMKLDGSDSLEPVWSHDAVDVSGLIRIGRAQRVVGVSYVTDRRYSHYFDPSMARLHRMLTRALPDYPSIRIVDASADEKTLIVFAASDVHAGTYFLYDATARRLSPLLDERPLMEGLATAPVRHVTLPGPDGVAIPAYLTVPAGSSGRGLPAIVMPHGGPTARDEWGFDWLAQYYAAQGYAVIQPNFRGSAGYGQDWLSGQGFLQWRTAIGDVAAAGRWLVSEGIADPDRLAIVGWSYGGYAALQSAATDQQLWKAVVAIAPVTDLPLLVDQSRGYVNFRQVAEMVGRGDNAREGSPARRAGDIRVPVMLVHGTEDGNVDVRHTRVMDRALSRASVPHETIVFEERDHFILDSDQRADMLRRSDAFLRAAFARR